MFAVGALPSAGDAPAFGGDHFGEVIHDEFVSELFSKWWGVDSVDVGVSDGDFGIGMLGGHDVDSALDVGLIVGLMEFSEFEDGGAGFERRVVAEGEPACEHGAESAFTVHRFCSKHLEGGLGEPVAGEEIGVEDFEVGTGADNGELGADFLSSSGDGAVADFEGGFIEEELHSKLVLEHGGQLVESFAGVDADFSIGKEGELEEIGFEVGEAILDLGGGEEFGGVGIEIVEFADDLGFLLVEGVLEASAGVVEEASLLGDFEPDRSAEEGGVAAVTGGLADGPDHAEVADRSADWSGGELDHGDRESAFGGGVGVGEAHDS